MATKTYYEKLKDPRWQKKRLEVMQRDGFDCTSCHDGTTSTLNVHHRVAYRKNTDPWDYELDELVTLCESCHAEISEYVSSITSIVLNVSNNVDAAKELYKIIALLDGMDPYDLKWVQGVLVTFLHKPMNQKAPDMSHVALQSILDLHGIKLTEPDSSMKNDFKDFNPDSNGRKPF